MRISHHKFSKFLKHRHDNFDFLKKFYYFYFFFGGKKGLGQSWEEFIGYKNFIFLKIYSQHQEAL